MHVTHTVHTCTAHFRYSHRACSYNQIITHWMHSVIHNLWHRFLYISTPTCFGAEMPSSGSRYNKDVYERQHASLGGAPPYTNNLNLKTLKYIKLITKHAETHKYIISITIHLWLSILRILACWDFSHSYMEGQNTDCHVGLYTSTFLRKAPRYRNM
jgi:hypothetical protein